MIHSQTIKAALVLPFVTVLSAADSTRAVYAELANINEVHLYVLVTPRGKYPDPETNALEVLLEQTITQILSASGIKSLRYISDGQRFAPCLDVRITWDTVEPGKPMAFIHVSIQLREEAKIERLPGVSVSKGAITWQSDELRHVQTEEVEQVIQRVISSRLARLIDDIQFATKSRGREPKRPTKVFKNELPPRLPNPALNPDPTATSR